MCEMAHFSGSLKRDHFLVFLFSTFIDFIVLNVWLKKKSCASNQIWFDDGYNTHNAKSSGFLRKLS